MSSPFLTLAEVAERHRVRVKAARRWLRAAGVPLFRRGRGEVLVPAVELERAERKATAPDPPRIELPVRNLRAIARRSA